MTTPAQYTRVFPAVLSPNPLDAYEQRVASDGATVRRFIHRAESGQVITMVVERFGPAPGAYRRRGRSRNIGDVGWPNYRIPSPEEERTIAARRLEATIRERLDGRIRRGSVDGVESFDATTDRPDPR